MRAEFWVEGAGEDTNESGTFNYLLTDQVRFYKIDAAENRAHACAGPYTSRGRNVEANQPLPVNNIPALAPRSD